MHHPLLLKNVDLYAPEHVGMTDLLVLGGKIAAVEKGLDVKVPDLETIDADGLMAAPGLVDIHCHFGGAGGEGGAVYRTPPLQLSDLTKAGITTAVGLLGTDGFCRSLRELLMKARALEEEGISTWIYTGSYQIPGPTLTGDVASDIMLIDKVIGLKVAYSDHRASQTGVQTLREYIARSRVGGLMAGKSGMVMVHIGEGARRLEPLLEVARNSDIPLMQMIPTHLNRSEDVFRQAITYGLAGGRVDITSGVSEKCFFSGAVKPSVAVARLLEARVPLEHITMSSDGNGVMTRLDPRTGAKQPLMAPVHSLFEEFCDMIREGLDVETAARVCSFNPAAATALPGKGNLRVGADADILLIDRDLRLKKVIARGRVLVNDDDIVKGLFER
ncbi:MAG: beta-aspartyl-peptidase [Pyramidobacter sp.]|jgi:beta-aspartyl-dipeptidase (metallo-type)